MDETGPDGARSRKDKAPAAHNEIASFIANASCGFPKPAPSTTWPKPPAASKAGGASNLGEMSLSRVA